MKKIGLWAGAFLIFAAAGAWIGPGQTAEESGLLIAVKTDTAPVLDGKVDAIWKKAREITIPVAGGANLHKGATEVALKAL
ncbi:MAG TPA: hypothetical protein VNN77_16530 [candidate division Zixibacteria bacterium]|nr:hypothetical protein [candidate division Zixibacteria bacterium]